MNEIQAKLAGHGREKICSRKMMSAKCTLINIGKIQIYTNINFWELVLAKLGLVRV